MAKAEGLDDLSVQDADEVARALAADIENGLASQEAARRLGQHGPNELGAKPRVPTWRRILAQFQDPLVYLLLGAIVVAPVAWVIEGMAGWPVDAIVIALVAGMASVVLWSGGSRKLVGRAYGRADDAGGARA